jgi:ribosomal protein S18 acetylase RimI-like enzyme
VKTRAAVNGDAHAIARIHVISWQAAYRGLMPDELLDKLSIARREAGWQSAIDRGQPKIVVAIAESADMLGWTAFGRCRDAGTPASTAELWAIYVDPAHWSRGVGHALWNAARASLADDGYEDVIVWTLRDNERALRFYAAVGFVVDAGAVKPGDFGGVTLGEVRCVARLRSRRAPDVQGSDHDRW